MNLFQNLSIPKAFQKNAETSQHKEVAISQIFPLIICVGKSKKIKGNECLFYLFLEKNRIIHFYYKSL
ncbi:hypothetical protein C1H87_15375 [Flavivirga eckloniae]|uniref:Uncharacterized protein n=1 Tax=Flavivirga eckloniae TaxID=1803846 RepID=A0A2K9PTW7_9FLAO|nr:hypothetical protein C1H87_15375 [Flavivirga eckloniae]